MKRFLIILFICLFIAGTASAIRIGGGYVGHGGGMSVGSGRVTTATPISGEESGGGIDYDGEWSSYSSSWGDNYTKAWR